MYPNGDWEIDDDAVGRYIEASPDREAFADRWDVPGVFLGLSTIFAEIYTPDELLDALDFSDECLYDERYDYEDSIMAGVYDIWVDCAEIDGQAFVVVATDPVEDEEQMVLFYADLLTDADVDAFEQMLGSLTLGDGATIAEAATTEPVPTVTIVTSTLNVRSGPGTNYSRVDAVYDGEELRVAGQSGDSAWLQIMTPGGQPGWISGNSRYTSLAGDCDAIPEAEAINGSAGNSGRVASGQGCYTFQNQLSAELNITFTRQDGDWDATFQVAPKGVNRQCFDPGSYTYTLDAPPPWGSSNGELTVNAGDNLAFPIYGE